jgi:Leucine-rich repeat (LRR) protein
MKLSKNKNMEENYTKKGGYGKRPLWQWVLLYVIIAGVAYGVIYYFFFAKNSGYNYNSSQSQNSGNPENSVIISQNKILDLSNRGLTSIPSYVFDQTNLEELNISHNFLTGAIQSQIGQLKNLKVLNASYNQMTGVPAEVGQLQNLQVLDLSYNQLTGLPNELGNLKNLKTLNLTGNSYSQQDLNYIRSKLPSTVDIIVSQ